MWRLFRIPSRSARPHTTSRADRLRVFTAQLPQHIGHFIQAGALRSRAPHSVGQCSSISKMLTSPSNSKSTESSSLDEPSAVESTPRTRGLPGGSGSSGAFLAAYHVEWDLVADAVPIGSVTLSSGAASGSSFRAPLSARESPRGSASSGERASSGESCTPNPRHDRSPAQASLAHVHTTAPQHSIRSLISTQCHISMEVSQNMKQDVISGRSGRPHRYVGE